MSATLPLHLRAARHWAARHPATAEDLLRLAEGQKLREPLSVKLRRLWCFIVGHDLVRDIWQDQKSPFNYEFHVGCRRCPYVRVEQPE